MSNQQNISSLMADVGPLANLLSVTEYEEDNVWTLLVDEETVLLADWDQSRGCLVLSGDVAEPWEADRLYWYETLLQYNDQWQQTGGLRMSLESPGGKFVQMCDLAAADLTAQQLCTVIENFVLTLKGWREILAQPRGEGPSDDDSVSAPEQPDYSQMIRP